VSKVSHEEIAHRVKEILDIERADWTGIPLPYNAKNPPPQVKVKPFFGLAFISLFNHHGSLG